MPEKEDEITLDLSGCQIFAAPSIVFTSKNTIIFGKNGTGKSTICKLLKDQITNREVRIFDGFDSIIDTDQKLNAVVLGEENVQIKKKIEEKNEELNNKQKEREKIEEKINKPKNETQHNLWVEMEKAEKKYKSAEAKCENVLTNVAAEIKKLSNPQIAKPTYDKRKLRKEIDRAHHLSIDEKNRYKRVLNSTKKVVGSIKWPNTDYQELLESVNGLLNKQVEPGVQVERIEGNKEKTNFAHEGLMLHKPNDVCAFCGNIITASEYKKLQKYFSEEDIHEFEQEINKMSQKVESEIKDVRLLKIDKDDYYEVFKEQALELSAVLSGHKAKCLSWLNNIKKSLEGKKANLFGKSNELEEDPPEDFSQIKKDFEELRRKNNSNDLSRQQEEAKNKLRYFEIAERLEKAKYAELEQERDNIFSKKKTITSEFDHEKQRIFGEGGLDYQIRKIEQEIARLQAQTKSETFLAKDINKKLRNLVSFEIVHQEEPTEQGYYLVKDLNSNKTRDITRLSTGEKNIIAFLYFIEKLDEIKKEESNPKKVIVFDDPMNSNDEDMQYLIMEELYSLMTSKKRSDDKFVIFTHNKHFYINLSHDLRQKKTSKKTAHIHLMSDLDKTKIINIESRDEDFATSYDELWNELIFLYKDEKVSSNMLLNPIRRIIETYTKFNSISVRDFCQKVTGAKKLFDVNSHSIDDFEAELNGKNKGEIINILKSCFEYNGAISHFQSHWGVQEQKDGDNKVETI
ncbi:MAG: AAA family ATPase [Lactobacillus delbrueckii]|jgi:wobble nucleotide-excising tRNase|nr:AAA family ATPase [Lactobacillus delbrueckii]